MDTDSGDVIGARLREIRNWRQMNLRATAQLAGLSHGYLGELERGDKPVTKRATLEALATALRVAPTELTGQPWTRGDPATSDAHRALSAMEEALDGYEIGHDPGGPVRAWPELAADVQRLHAFQHVHADYAAQGELLPPLLRELHAAYIRLPSARRAVLHGLLTCYSSAAWTTKRLGGRGLPLLAARLAQEIAELLDEAPSRAYAVWLRGDAAGAANRERQLARCEAAADRMAPYLDDTDALQMTGMLHLSGALAAASLRDSTTAAEHLSVAAELADRMDAPVGQFGSLWFGAVNVRIWSVSLHAELGEPGRALHAARSVTPHVIPSPSRRAEYWSEYGRLLVQTPSSRPQGLAALLTAERLAPQRVRNDVFIREIVSDQLRHVRADAAGRELRGLAHRVGLAPN